MFVINRVLTLFALLSCVEISTPAPPGTTVQSESFRLGVFPFPLSGNTWSSIDTALVSKLKRINRTVAGRVNGGFFFEIRLFQLVTSANMRAFAMGPKSKYRAEASPRSR